jgi:hypothetical protein
MQLLLSRSNTILEVAHLMKVIKRDRYASVRRVERVRLPVPTISLFVVMLSYHLRISLTPASLPATLNAPLSAGWWKSQNILFFPPAQRQPAVCLGSSSAVRRTVADRRTRIVRTYSPFSLPSPLSCSGISSAPSCDRDYSRRCISWPRIWNRVWLCTGNPP